MYKPYMELPYMQNDPKLKVFAEQGADPNNIVTPNIVGVLNWFTIMWTEIQHYLNGDKTAQQALDDSVTNYTKALQ